jgi:hypothetical protein
MTHGELQDIFILDFQKANPAARIFENHSGKARINKKLWIPYGMPSSGGGSDLMAFYPGGITEFYEIKTIDDIMRPKQIDVATLMTRLGFKYFIVRETGEGYVVEEFHL